MKRRPILPFILILSLLLSINAMAGRQHYTIAQVREQANAGWHQIYDANGQSVVVDIPVTVPEASAFPTLRSVSMHPSDQADVQRLGKDRPVVANGFSLNNNERSLIYDRISLAPSPTPPRNLRAFTQSFQIHQLETDKAYALRNPATITDALKLADKVAEKYFPGLDIRFVPFRAIAGVDARMADREKGLVVGHTWEDYIGSLTVYFNQALRNIPVLGTVEMAWQQPSLNGDNPRFSPDLNNRVSIKPAEPDNRDSLLERVILNLLAEEAVLEEDVPLCGLNQVYQAYEPLIEAGLLRRVDSLRLGYVGWYDSKRPEAMTLLPCWVLEGLVFRNGKDSGTLEGAGGLVDETQTTVLLVNAQTGELIDPWRVDKNRS